MLFFLISCEKNIDNAMNEEALNQTFQMHKSKFKQLAQMIIEDSNNLKKLKISEKRIGEYSLHDEGWAKKYGEFVSIEIALKESSISLNRYQKYKSLLGRSESSKVLFYDNEVDITVSATGFVFGGCLSLVLYKPSGASLKKPSWAQVFYSTQFEENWYGVTRCD